MVNVVVARGMAAREGRAPYANHDHNVLAQFCAKPEIVRIHTWVENEDTAPSVFGGKLQCELVRKVEPRDECHSSHACSLQANMSGNQWHPRVQTAVRKRAPDPYG